MTEGRMSLSIVIPVYNAEDTIGRLVERLLSSVAADDTQIVLVNDGSRDRSHVICRDLAGRHPEAVTYIELSRNFGEHNAVMAGLNHVRGDYVVIMDDDFQNPPEAVDTLVAEARRGGHDVVYSRFEEKRHSFLRNLGSQFNDLVAAWLLDKPEGLYLSSFKCLSRFLVEQIVAYTGPAPYVDGLILRVTRRIGVVTVEHHERQAGQSGYTLRKLVRLWLNMFINFSVLPLRLCAFLGFAVSCLGLLMGLWTVAEKLFTADLPSGWPMLYVTVVLFSGIQLVMLGLLGEYAGRVLFEVNRSPQYVIRGLTDRGDQP